MDRYNNRPHILLVIAVAGLLGGTLDIADAMIFYGLHNGISPTRILQGIASGLLGRAAFAEGLRSAFLGLFLHFFIAYTAATFYILASRKLPLSRHPFFCGTMYGIGLYCVMNYVVLPLSRVGHRSHPSPLPFINGVAALIFCIGIPVALIARRYVSSETKVLRD